MFSEGAFFIGNMNKTCPRAAFATFLVAPAFSHWTDFFSHWPPRPGVKKAVFLLVFIAFLLKAPQANIAFLNIAFSAQDRVSAKGGVKAKPPTSLFVIRPECFGYF